MIGNEVDEKRHSRRDKEVFKIDFEMTYDNVDEDFLNNVIEQKGFSIRWRS